MQNWVTIGVELETKSFEKQIEFLEDKLDTLSQEYEGALKDKSFPEDELKKYASEIEKTSNSLIELRNKQKEVNGAGFTNVVNSVNNVGNTMRDIVRTTVRWGLAIFSIRSVYMFIRRSISTISEYNAQVGADIEYIRFALASTLEPVVIRLISLVKTLLTYINYIAKAWFGVDLFAGASVDKFKQNEKALGGSVKKAKELNKQIAGFDEMNVLQDNTDTSGGGGGGAGGGAIPDFDLSKLQGDVPAWIKWIADNKDLILAVMAGVTAGLLAWKLGLTAIQSLGIGILIAGIVLLVQDIIDFLKDPSWKKFLNILTDISVIALGIGVIIGSWPVIIIAVIALIVTEIIKNWDKIKEILGKVWEWIKEKVINPVVEQFRLLWEAIKTSLSVTWNFAMSIVKGIATWIKNTVITPVSNFFKGLWQGIKNGVSGAVNNIKSFFNGIPGFFQGIINKIKGFFSNVGTTAGNVIGNTFKGVINKVLKSIENILNAPIKAINGLIGKVNEIPGVSMSRLSTFKFPRLAKGGIVNMPGRGVPIGSAIAGERGAEGVIPLTDSQQMALLGEAIGKYITVNANITNTMNGRVISRELQKVQNESDFAFNR